MTSLLVRQVVQRAAPSSLAVQPVLSLQLAVLLAAWLQEAWLARPVEASVVVSWRAVLLAATHKVVELRVAPSSVVVLLAATHKVVELQVAPPQLVVLQAEGRAGLRAECPSRRHSSRS